jgi:hypothetical protein
MKKMCQWDKPVACLALVLSAVGSMKATATVFPSIPTGNRNLESQITSYPKPENVLLTQRLLGECRAAARSTFIYQERSTANRIRALQANDRVILAEERGRNGWIAINSPISGFVQAKDLKFCSESTTSSSSEQNLCRQVIYRGMEGVAVRERPNLDSPQVDTVFLGDRITLSNPPEFITDNTGREWTRLAAPSGWMTNGVPARGDINLGACL